MNPSLGAYLPRGTYPPHGIVLGFMSSLPTIRPRVLPADVSMALGSESCPLGAHPPLVCLGAAFPWCACNLAFI